MTVNLDKLRQAALQLGHVEPISIEPDGIIWLGVDPDRVYLTSAQQNAVVAKMTETQNAQAAARASAVAKLAELGLTNDEIAALVG